ncbi:alpha/beta fold hydrolase [Rhizobium binxianense]|uniref:alpha/beta fold hydrolase n=1 Tax=Rhizobium binxianense TaxID=3024242 RepID=UPI0023624757|nr:alpha/beta fold hydrolase [Rhizobium sp. MJ37]MDC9835681.1 alpha/beta fold hydrolase [Rhizobium sp. MJ37]
MAGCDGFVKAMAMADSRKRPFLSLLGGFDCAGLAAGSPASTRKARALVAYLALQAGQSQSREKLAALLWGGTGEEQARANLRQTLSVLRRALLATGREWFRIEGDRVALDLGDADLDVRRFEALAAGSATEDLEQAIALYSGELLEGFNLAEEPFEEWVRTERERLRITAIAALEKLITCYIGGNEPGASIPAATRLLTLEPLREDVHRTLMRAYAAKGRFNLALAQYQSCADTLRKQLGVQPEPETRALHRDLLSRRMAAAGRAPEEGASFEARPQTRYVKSDGVNIAYQVTGDGAFDVVYVQGWVSNLDYAWDSPRLSGVLHRLGSFCRLIRIDKRGTGLSDRGTGFPTLEQRMQDVRAVLDAVGSQKTVLFGSSEGGVMCMLFAASYPERTAALILHGAYARGLWSPDYPWGRTREELEEELLAIEREWGRPMDLSRAAPSLVDNMVEREWFAGYLRNSASPADAIALWRWSVEIDACDILPAVRVPTLITHRTGDRWVKPEEGRYLASRIPGAIYVELPGDDHIIWGADSDRLIDEIQRFLASAPPAPTESALLTVLHLDVQGASSGRVKDWQDDAVRQLRAADGEAIDLRESGLVAAFRQPSQAITCAFDLRGRLRHFGLDVRAAIHIGECERQGGLYAGPVLRLAAGFADCAGPGDIIASRTVRDLVIGANLSFDLRGQLDVPGIPGPWPYFSIGAALKS